MSLSKDKETSEFWCYFYMLKWVAIVFLGSLPWKATSWACTLLIIFLKIIYLLLFLVCSNNPCGVIRNNNLHVENYRKSHRNYSCGVIKNNIIFMWRIIETTILVALIILQMLVKWFRTFIIAVLMIRTLLPHSLFVFFSLIQYFYLANFHM